MKNPTPHKLRKAVYRPPPFTLHPLALSILGRADRRQYPPVAGLSEFLEVGTKQ